MNVLKYTVVALLLSVCCTIPHTLTRLTEPVSTESLSPHSVETEEHFAWKGEESARLSNVGDGRSALQEEDVTCGVPIVINKRVEFFLDYFQNEARQSFSRYLERSTRYAGPMRDILKTHGLPGDLVYLALIESGFYPFAYSRARAMGPWQFMAATAKVYGLKRTHWIDERRDPVKSTEAAARYLKDLYAIFNDWYLVLAAYNAGQQRVSKAISESESRDFWGLDLPSQTEEYVPRFVAAVILAENPERYGFDVEYEDAVDHEVVFVAEKTDLKTAAACMGCEVELLRELNPELRHLVTPPDEPGYPLRIPKGARECFHLCWEETVGGSGCRCRPQG